MVFSFQSDVYIYIETDIVGEIDENHPFRFIARWRRSFFLARALVFFSLKDHGFL